MKATEIENAKYWIALPDEDTKVIKLSMCQPRIVNEMGNQIMKLYAVEDDRSHIWLFEEDDMVHMGDDPIDYQIREMYKRVVAIVEVTLPYVTCGDWNNEVWPDILRAVRDALREHGIDA